VGSESTCFLTHSKPFFRPDRFPCGWQRPALRSDGRPPLPLCRATYNDGGPVLAIPRRLAANQALMGDEKQASDSPIELKICSAAAPALMLGAGSYRAAGHRRRWSLWSPAEPGVGFPPRNPWPPETGPSPAAPRTYLGRALLRRFGGLGPGEAGAPGPSALALNRPPAASLRTLSPAVSSVGNDLCAGPSLVIGARVCSHARRRCPVEGPLPLQVGCRVDGGALQSVRPSHYRQPTAASAWELRRFQESPEA